MIRAGGCGDPENGQVGLMIAQLWSSIGCCKTYTPENSGQALKQDIHPLCAHFTKRREMLGKLSRATSAEPALWPSIPDIRVRVIHNNLA